MQLIVCVNKTIIEWISLTGCDAIFWSPSSSCRDTLGTVEVHCGCSTHPVRPPDVCCNWSLSLLKVSTHAHSRWTRSSLKKLTAVLEQEYIEEKWYHHVLLTLVAGNENNVVLNVISLLLLLFVFLFVCLFLNIWYVPIVTWIYCILVRFSACTPLYRVWAGYPEICVFYCCHFGPPVGWGSCSLQQLLCAARGTLWTPCVHHGETIATVTEWKRKELGSFLAFQLHNIYKNIMWPKNWGEAAWKQG